jgi:diguanylate cyclase (GGDEF)-like protein/PAS domain S-box-containing protein
VVSTGEQAVEEANIHKPDLVLMDIFLEGEMDGIEAANQIHSRFNIPVIFVTAYNDKQILEQAKISEPYAFITKPFNERELYANIEIVLQKHQMGKRLEHLNNVLTAIKNINQLILKEKKSKSLMKGVCDLLTGTKSFDTAWIVSIDSPGKFTLSAYSGPCDNFRLLEKGVESGYLPTCIKKALGESDVIVINDIGPSCLNCPMSRYHKGIGVLSARICFEDKVYGVLNVSIPLEFVKLKAEQELIKEVADDCAFALHKIELEEAHRQAEESLKASEEKFAKTFFSSPALMAITNIDDGRIFDVNQTFIDLLGYTREELIGGTTTELNLWVYPEEWHHFIKTFKKHKEAHNMEIAIRPKSGGISYTLFSGVIIHFHRVPYLLSIAIDITERKKLEEQLTAAAITDELTGLYNRRGFFTLAEQQYQLANRSKRKMSLLYMDIDNMKAINDRFGHKVGDEALVDTANILKKTFRKSDILCRIGGDEFAVLLTEHDRTDIETIIIENIGKKILHYNEQNHQHYQLSLSIGMAHFNPEYPCTIDDLIIKADAAMYENKRYHKLHQLDQKPLPPAKEIKSQRRKHQRLKIDNYWTRLNALDKCKIKNISCGGLGVETPQQLSINKIYCIEVSPAINDATLFKATVVWSSLVGAAYETGFEFTGLSNHQENSINRFINRFSSGIEVTNCK